MIVFNPELIDDSVVGAFITVYTDDGDQLSALVCKGDLWHDENPDHSDHLDNGYFFVLQDGRAMCFLDTDVIFIEC